MGAVGNVSIAPGLQGGPETCTSAIRSAERFGLHCLDCCLSDEVRQFNRSSEHHVDTVFDADGPVGVGDGEGIRSRIQPKWQTARTDLEDGLRSRAAQVTCGSGHMHDRSCFLACDLPGRRRDTSFPMQPGAFLSRKSTGKEHWKELLKSQASQEIRNYAARTSARLDSSAEVAVPAML